MAAAVVQAEGLLGHGQVEGQGVGAHGVVDGQPPDALHQQQTALIRVSPGRGRAASSSSNKGGTDFRQAPPAAEVTAGSEHLHGRVRSLDWRAQQVATRQLVTLCPG